MQVVVEQGHHGDGHGYAADPQPPVDEIMILEEVQLFRQNVFHGVVQRVLDGRPVPLVDLDDLLLFPGRGRGRRRRAALLAAVAASHLLSIRNYLFFDQLSDLS
jgi:hypothetical protein